MASMAEAFIDTAELTRAQCGILATPPAADYTDQLSRFERRSSAETWRGKQTQRERTYFSRGQRLTLRWRDFGQALPVWFDPVMLGFAELVTLEPNWDSYGGKAIDKAVVDNAIALLDAMLDPASPVPSIVPLSSGGLQVEWHRQQQDLEIVFEPRQAPEFFYKNARTGVEEDGSVYPRLALVTQLIRGLE
jgi:hypothetical protein